MGDPSLELKVITLNINEGHNQKLMEQCQILKEYAQYVEKVRRHTKEMELSEVVEQAIKECLQEGILVDFLRRNKSEVIAMSIFEYDKDKEEKKLRKAEYEYGYDSGYEAGFEKVVRSMIADKVSVEKIKQYTGYTAEKIREIENGK